ncbi:NADP-dependent oxidoreductase [Oenococcus oeni]
MKAIEINEFGDVDVFYATEKKLADPKPNQVLVKNFATAIDPYDVKYRSGFYGGSDKLPTVLGSSVAGIVQEIGSEVTKYSVGDRVVASTHLRSYAEQVLVSEKQLALIPDNLTFVQAAGVALGYQTGYQAVIKEIKLKKGQSILIHGGSGAVGFAAIQAAEKIGAGKIYTTAGTKGKAFLNGFNPEIAVYDYKKENFTNISEKIDAILDTVGGETQDKSLKLLKENGKLCSTVGLTDKAKKSPFDTDAIYLDSGSCLTELLKDMSQGLTVLKIAKISQFSLKNLRSMHKEFENDHPLGKLILEL